jgi:hypothetical protein
MPTFKSQVETPPTAGRDLNASCRMLQKKRLQNFSIQSFTDPYSPGWTFGLPFRGFWVSWSHIQGHTVRFLWTSDQPVAETSTYTGQHNRQTSMPRAGFEPATPATKRPQTYTLVSAATGIRKNISIHWQVHDVIDLINIWNMTVVLR